MLKEVERGIRMCREKHGSFFWVAAVSGGADSMALLQVLAELRDRLSCTLAVAHFNHRLRGEASRADAVFVEEQARARDLPFYLGSGDVARQARRSGLSLEDAARRARHRFFRQVLRQTGAEAVALAHTLDDQAETLLLHLFRGAGLQGLGGMKPRVVLDGLPVVRPLLGVSREQVVRYLKRRSVPWREDASNRDSRFTRNRLRHAVLPEIKRQINPSVHQVLARSAGILQLENDALDAAAAAALPACAGSVPGSLDTGQLLQMHPGLRARMLRTWLEHQGCRRFGSDQADRFTDLLDGRGTKCIQLGGGSNLRRRYQCLELLAPGTPEGLSVSRVRLPTYGGMQLPAWGIQATVSRETGYRKQPAPGAGRLPALVYLCAARIGRAGVFLRPRRAGDRFCPLGSGGTRKVQDILVDHKVPRDLRDRVPLLECRGEVVWVAGCRVAEGWQARAGEASRLVSLEPLH